MRIGVCNTDLSVMPADEQFALMAKLGFRVAQISLAMIAETGFADDGVFEIPRSVAPEVIKTICAASKRYDVEIISVNGTYNMAHPEKVVRDEGLARFEGFAEAVSAMGVKYISLCSGTRFSEQLWTYHPDNESQAAWEDCVASMRGVCAIAERLGLTLAIETEASNVINTPEKARRIMDTVGSPALKMIIDCANLFHIGQAKRENVTAVMENAFACFGKDIVMAHAKDIREGDGIDFCATGEGIVDFPLFLRLLKQYGYEGDMLLHGIYDVSKMNAGIEVIRNAEVLY